MSLTIEGAHFEIMSEVYFHQKNQNVKFSEKYWKWCGAPLIHFESLTLEGAHLEIMSEVYFHQKNQNFKISENIENGVVPL